MSVLNDIEIAALCQGEKKMIDPFEAHQIKTVISLMKSGAVGPAFDLKPVAIEPMKGERVVSYGCTSFGYDMRVAGDFKVFSNAFGSVIDPKNMPEEAFVEIHKEPGEAVIVPPNSFVLARSIEHFDIPRDVIALVVGKSTYARCGVIVCCTPIEPEWRGHLTVEISNTTPLPAKIYAHEGIAQVVFLQGNPCGTSYEDRGGKYQDQKAEVTLPRMAD